MDEDYLEDDFDEDDQDWDDEATETLSCPECGTEIYEDAVQCPVCGTYITFNTSIWSGRPLWWILLGLLGIVAIIVILATVPFS